jgi:uncharacterized protein YyaL (SSP411 family)
MSGCLQRIKVGVFFAACLLLAVCGAQAEDSGISWQRTFTEATFAQAKEQHRLVILDLEAIWCHWCHVMDEQTYSRSDIRASIAANYIPVRIDQDSRPDLANRYRDYGWPATIIFNSDGEELDKLSGFVEPDQMSTLLGDYAKNPHPREKSTVVQYSEQSSLSDELKQDLQQRFEKSADRKNGGLRTSHKYLDADTIEYGLKKVYAGDRASADFIRKTLDENLHLLDPAWGGVYQYSTHGDWQHPHFEKIAVKQADDLRLYALAYAQWSEPRYREATESIRRFLDTFLRDADGGFYTSQDADLVKGEHSAEYFGLSDTERRKQGIPAIDKHIYASENGRLISALTAVYSATGDSSALERAIQSAQWIAQNRALAEGGFRHGEHDPSGPYLCDTLYMGRAFLDLYAVTGTRDWLRRAEQAAAFIDAHFAPSEKQPGYLTSALGAGILKPLPVLAENIALVRFYSALTNYTGNPTYKKAAGEAMRLLTTKEIATDSITEPGILLADDDFNSPPLHVVTVAKKDDTTGKELFLAALKYPSASKRTEWWDRAEGPMPNPDVQYPVLPKAAAFVCTQRRCSLPIFQAAKVAESIRRLSTARGD